MVCLKRKDLLWNVVLIQMKLKGHPKDEWFWDVNSEENLFLKAEIYSEAEDSEFSRGTNEACILFCGVPSGAVNHLTWGLFVGILDLLKVCAFKLWDPSSLGIFSKKTFRDKLISFILARFYVWVVHVFMKVLYWCEFLSLMHCKG